MKQSLDSVIQNFLDDRSRHLYRERQRIADLEQQIPELSDIRSELGSAGSTLVMEKISGVAEAAERYEVTVDSLEKRRQKILSAHGLTGDDLKIHYLCEKCKDTGYIDGHPCECLKSYLIEAAFSDSELGSRARQETFDSFDLSYYPDAPDAGGKIPSVRSYMNEVRKYFKSYCSGFDKVDQNYLFFGGPGLGKTFLCNCIAVDLIERGYSVVYTTASLLVDRIRESLRNDKSLDRLRQSIDSCRLLIIDDLGAEYQSDFSDNQLFEIINSRLLSDGLMIISTNLSSKAIIERYDDRFSSRIRGNFQQIRFFGDDIRLIKYRKHQ